MRDFTDNPRPVVADDFEPGLPARGRRRFGVIGPDDDGQAGALKFLQGVEQRLSFIRGQFDAQDSGKLAAEPGHAAFQPVATVLGHDARDGFDQTRSDPGR